MAGLNERKQRILHAVVTDYIQTAEPVGSRSISRRHQMDLSAATIRNEMADLEELGYLTQPHTSAGRIPSQQGYRFYVDALMDAAQLAKEEHEYLSGVFTQLEKMREIDQIIQQTAKVLSVMTCYTSLVMGPQFRRSAFKQMRLIPLDEQRALVVLLTDTGYIKNKVIDLPQALSSDELVRIVNYLNEQLAGQTISSLSATRLKKLRSDLYARIELLDHMLHLLEDCSAEGESRVFLGGTSNILNQPEFKDVEKVRHLLTLFEQGERLSFILETSLGGVSIRIGTENAITEISDCSLVTATYHLHERPVGTIGVLGPTRMEYSR
ncbi:heat-inducible transcriptional repressor HrcA [Dethiobacter alkaliphilus]|uniref:heat-inducible transcriptional repressor HrcA n=1 Tax=Dethiobacter alkaliphilus TaxID=427926 RepID=UPI002226538B|nr:heat-inducible transcriptional repressor HrcA [Dethiobacter alkaliphilus]MCW3489317.1 heat-inducible transcriptional repressor HrcA [Dethiobacter alkaliphilus]